MFIDRAVIHVKAGNGGNGCLAFRREKFVPKGGPSGGDGGKGGNVIFRGSRHMNTLLSFKFQQHIKSDRGAHGTGSNKHGRSGEDIIVDVPLGTIVSDQATGEVLCDIKEEDFLVTIAKGGDGGAKDHHRQRKFMQFTFEIHPTTNNQRDGNCHQCHHDVEVTDDRFHQNGFAWHPDHVFP